jgi:hypothetical protein
MFWRKICIHLRDRRVSQARSQLRQAVSLTHLLLLVSALAYSSTLKIEVIFLRCL